ncbi:MAG: site-2 protease family protein [Oscillospiraceae bacterium]|nr:site-2 protease family protein [Oscillospiraceae bacterium]
MTILTILATLLCFGVIIFIHEAGHFFVAKKCGVRVLEFSMGMGPILFSKKKGETRYSIRAFPIGGFCAMEGEDKNSSDPRAFRNQAVWKRMLVIVAGAVMNLILGFLLIIAVTCIDGQITTTTISDFHTDAEGVSTSTSEKWLKPDDRFIKINGLSIYTASDISYALQNTDSELYEVVVEREGELITLEDVKFKDRETQGILDFYVYGQRLSPMAVLSYSCKSFATTARLIWISFADLLRGRYGFRDMSGVVGIIDATTEVVSMRETLRDKILTMLDLMSFITINIGIFNLIPFPALDGGRMVFLIAEAILRKPVPAKVEGAIHLVGLSALMLLMIAVTCQDIFKIFTQ